MERRENSMDTALCCVAALSFFLLSISYGALKTCAMVMTFASVEAFVLFRDARLEADPDLGKKAPRYTPIFSIFSIFLAAAVPILGYRVLSLHHTGRMIASDLGGILLTTSVYYILLALILPLLRKHFSARACAGLWMLPALLLFLTNNNRISVYRKPLLVLDLPEHLVPAFLTLWLGGAAALMVWSILSHLSFRHSILKRAEAVEDPDVLAVWARVCQQARREKQPVLCTSPDVRTPLSIGLISATTRVVLPEKDYAPEDLELVLKHELVHIMRQDSQTKFFLTLMRALSWFNPLMWLAMRKSSDDLEISCDETVLADVGQDRRERYAALLLRTAGDQRGFTTCLSASGAALRYRMRAVVAPSRRRVGGLMAGLMVIGLFALSGTAVFSTRCGTAEELALPRGVEAYTISTAVDLQTKESYGPVEGEALLAYLGGLPVRQIPGRYSLKPSARSYEPEGQYLEFKVCSSKDDLRYFKLSQTGLRVCHDQYQDVAQDESYLVDGEIDWDYIRTLLTAKDKEDAPWKTAKNVNA